MPDTALLHQHLEKIRLQTPALASRWLDACLQRLQTPGLGGLNADEVRRVQPLSQFLQAHREPFINALSTALQSATDAALACPSAGGGASPKASALLSFDALTLVDEAQAERDIEISRIGQWVELQAEWELRELRGLLSSLQSSMHAARRPNLHPGDPTVVARSLAEAAQAIQLDAALRSVLMRVAGVVLAEALKPQYKQWAEQLKESGARTAVYRPVPSPSARRPEPGTNPANLVSAPPGRDALSDLLERRAPSKAAASQRAAPPVAAEQALLASLFQQILIDPRLAEPVRLAIGRLEGAVRRMAEQDSSMLSNQAHPAWQLINQLAEHAADRPQGDDPRNTDFLQFVEPLVERLASQPALARSSFTSAVAEVESFIAQDEAEQLKQSAPALEAFRQAERERELLPLLQQQVQMQVSRAEGLSPSLRQFLTGPWAEVLARTMAREGEDAAVSQSRVALVDELLASLLAPLHDGDRQRLRKSLPGLIAQLQAGMALIELPQPHRERVLSELMQVHRRFLTLAEERPVAAPPAPSAADDFFDDDALLEQPNDQWSSSGLSDTHVGALTTVPMGLDEQSATEAAAQWLKQLPLSMRCKVFLQGQWTTARLIWRSDNGQFFMFSSPLAGGKHSMTRRAIERLRAEGLITDVAEPSLLERAARGVLDSEA